MKAINIICISGLLLLISCNSTKYLSIDVMKPASVKFDKKVVSITIIDNAGGLIIDSLATANDTDLERSISYSKDIFANSLKDYMQEEDYFHEVSLHPTIMRADKSYGMQYPLTVTQIQSIGKDMDAEAVVSMDAYSMEIGDQLVSFDGFYFNGSKAIGTIDYIVYDSNGNTISSLKSLKDSVYWLGEAGSESEYYALLAQKLAEGICQQLLPHWESQERFLYTDGTKLMKEANKLLDQNKENWAEVAKLWGQAYEVQKKSKQKAKIASNIALANENLGDIMNAAQWIRIASNHINESGEHSDEYQYINWYKLKLLERERDHPKLQEQIGIVPE